LLSQVRRGSSTGPLLTRQRLCGINETQTTIVFNGPMYISFKTDSSITAKGFSAEISGKEKHDDQLYINMLGRIS